MAGRRMFNTWLTIALAAALAAFSLGSQAQAAPPGRINFQGIAQDGAGNALNGPVAMTFRFYDDPAAGALLWEEVYDAAAHPPAVSVLGGLFTMALGDPAHRTAGDEPTVIGLFSNHAAVYLGLQMGTDPEMAPRILVAAAPFALNADALDGMHAADFLDTASSGNFLNTSETPQIKSGKVTFTSTVDYGIDASGPSSGGHFTSSAGGWALVAGADGINAGGAKGGIFQSLASGHAEVASGDVGIDASGSVAGGYFHGTGSGTATAGAGENGLTAAGNEVGGIFYDRNDSGYAKVGYGNTGIDASGSFVGGYFHSSDGGQAWVAGADGINASGAKGGIFHGSGTGSAELASANTGIDAYGSQVGGYFHGPGTGVANCAMGDQGLYAGGTVMGGYFFDIDDGGTAKLASGALGIDAYGAWGGGYFKDGVDDIALLAYNRYAIDAYGQDAGGYFHTRSPGWAKVASGNFGIVAEGTWQPGGGEGGGGRFTDTSSGVYADVATGAYKIYSNGSVHFVQNHPAEKDRGIVYTCPEGDEAATYTRGTGKLVNGEARVKLGETFKWVTNPDIGLTAHLTPVGDWADLYIAQKSTAELVVRSHGGAQDGAFDYIVYGLRIGFEELSVVQEKQIESFIPSFKRHRERYAKFPELRAYNSLERFKVMESAVRGVPESSLDLSRAKALKNAIHEYDPVTDPPVEKLFGYDRQQGLAEMGHGPDSPPGSPTRPPSFTPQSAAVAEKGTMGPIPAASTSGVVEIRPDLPCFPSSEAIEAGEVVVMDPSQRGFVRRCGAAADPKVLGIATGPGDACKDARTGEEESSSARVSVATSGVLPCKVDTAYGPILEGDLLVASQTPGHAMRADNPAQGTVIGKALEPLASGTGLIKLLVMLR